MSTSSKFGVQVNGVGNIIQPKYVNRFRVKFYGFGLTADSTKLEQNIAECERPKFKQNEVAVHSYNSIVYLGAKTEWQTIKVVVRDDITNGSLAAIGQQLQKQYNFFEQTSAVSGSDYKFRMEVETLDGTHASALELWNIEGCWITDVETSGGKYSETAAMQTISFTVRYDNATLIAGSNENVVTSGGDPFPANVSATGGNLGNALSGFIG